MSGYLDFIKTDDLVRAIDENRRDFEAKFPELIKRLIDATCNESTTLRMPTGDDVSIPGFDGIVHNQKDNQFVINGTSVWEVGTDKKVKKKINGDYRKRTNNSLGLDKTETTLYLCTPRKWPKGDSIEKWKNSHTDWKDVNIYDAVIIKDWLNKTPSVCAWFIEQYIGKDISISTLRKAWEDLSGRTKPKLVSSFFDYSSGLSADILIKNTIIRLRADSKIDAFGYTLTFLLKEQLENVVVVKNKRTLELVQEVASNQIIVINFEPDSIQAKNNNIIINCCSYHNKRNGDIVLPSRDFCTTNKALVEAGVDASYAANICQATHCRTNAIMRKIRSNTYEENIPWREYQDNKVLKSILCLQKCINNSDIQVMCELSGYAIDEVKNELEVLSNLDDSPLVQMGDGYIIASPEEASMILIGETPSYISQKAHDFLLEVLDKISKKEQWRDLSEDALIGIARRILIFYIYENEFLDDSSIIEQRVNEIIDNDILLKDERLQRSIIPHLCELSPKILARYIDTHIESIETNVLIESIEILTESPFIDEACDLLCKAYSVTKNKDFSDILSMALSPFKFLEDFDIDSKKEKIKSLIKTNDMVSGELINKLLDTRGYYVANKIIEKKQESIHIAYSELRDFYEDIVRYYLNKTSSCRHYELLKTILDKLEFFEPSKLTNLFELFDLTSFTYAQVAEIQSMANHQRLYYSKRKYAQIADALTALIDRVNKTNPDSLYLFVSYYYHIDYDHDTNLSFEEREELQHEKRKASFEKLKSNNGYIDIVSEIIKDEYPWGVFIGENDKKKKDVWIKALIDKEKYRVASAIIDILPLDNKTSIISQLDIKTRKSIVTNLNRYDVCEYLSEDEREIFWGNKEMRSFSEVVYKNILRYNPEGLLRYLALDKDATEEQIIETLGSISNLPPKESYYDGLMEYEYEQILKKVSVQQKEIGKIVIELLIKKRINYSTEHSNWYLFEHPEIVEKITASKGLFMSDNLFGIRIPFSMKDKNALVPKFFDTIMSYNDGCEIIVAIIINTLYQKPNDEEVTLLLKYLEQNIDKIHSEFSIKIDMTLINGYHYKNRAWTLDVNDLIKKCDNLPRTKRLLDDIMNVHIRQKESFRRYYESVDMERDKMSIVKHD